MVGCRHSGAAFRAQYCDRLLEWVSARRFTRHSDSRAAVHVGFSLTLRSQIVQAPPGAGMRPLRGFSSLLRLRRSLYRATGPLCWGTRMGVRLRANTRRPSLGQTPGRGRPLAGVRFGKRLW